MGTNLYKVRFLYNGGYKSVTVNQPNPDLARNAGGAKIFCKINKIGKRRTKEQKELVYKFLADLKKYEDDYDLQVIQLNNIPNTVREYRQQEFSFDSPKNIKPAIRYPGIAALPEDEIKETLRKLREVKRLIGLGGNEK